MKQLTKFVLLLVVAITLSGCKKDYTEKETTFLVASEYYQLSTGEKIHLVKTANRFNDNWIPMRLTNEYDYENFGKFVKEYETGYEYTILVIERMPNSDVFYDGNFNYNIPPTYKFKKIIKKEHKNSEGLPEPISGEE